MQPQQRGQRTDRRHFRSQIRAEDVGVGQRFPAGLADGDVHDHDGRHVVHDGADDGREESGPDHRVGAAHLRQRFDGLRQVRGQPRIF